jgi:hypothetical protein
MRTIILYRQDSDTYPAVRTFLGDFARLHPDKSIEEVNPDSVEGQELMKLYGVVELPAVLSLNFDMSLNNMWSGAESLNIDEVAYFTESKTPAETGATDGDGQADASQT